MNWIPFAAITLGLLALWPAWRMFHAAFFMTRRHRWFVILEGIFFTGILVPPAWLVPFWLTAGEDVAKYETLVNVILYGAVPLGLIALTAFVADYVSMAGIPAMCALGGAACLAVTVLPILYLVYAEQIHTYYDIRVDVEPDQDVARYFRLQ